MSHSRPRFRGAAHHYAGQLHQPCQSQGRFHWGISRHRPQIFRFGRGGAAGAWLRLRRARTHVVNAHAGLGRETLVGVRLPIASANRVENIDARVGDRRTHALKVATASSGLVHGRCTYTTPPARAPSLGRQSALVVRVFAGSRERGPRARQSSSPVWGSRDSSLSTTEGAACGWPRNGPRGS